MVSRITMLIATVAAAAMLGHSVGLKVVEVTRPIDAATAPELQQCKPPQVAVTLTATGDTIDPMGIGIDTVAVSGESPWKYYREVSRVGSTVYPREPGQHSVVTAYICLQPGN